MVAAAGGFIKDTFLGGAEKEAARAERKGQEASTREFRQAGTDIGELFAPQVEFGGQAFGQQAALAGARGPEEEARALAAFQESPGQRFLRERGEKSLIRNATAIGGIGGGNIRRALQEQGIGFAAQQQQQRFNNLGAITGVGQAGLTQQAQGLQFGAAGAAQGLVGAGIARGQQSTLPAAAIRSTGETALKGFGFGGFGLPAPV